MIMHGPIRVGSAAQEIDVIWDTTVNGMVLESADLCSGCVNATYNTSASSTYAKLSDYAHRVEDDFPLFDAGDALNVTDTVYLGWPKITAAEFPFYALTKLRESSSLMDDVDGILGFSRGGRGNHNPLIMEQIKSTNHISTETISFLMDSPTIWGGNSSWADIGAYKNDSILGGKDSNIVWFNQMESDQLWSLGSVQAIQHGLDTNTKQGRTAGYQFGPELTKPAVFSTGTALIHAPYNIGYEITNRQARGLKFFNDEDTGLTIVSCAQKQEYENLYIWIDGFKFEILLNDYFLSINDMLGDDAENQFNDVCILGIVDDKDIDFWMFGEAFMRGYYTIHENEDHTKPRLGFAPGVNSNKNVVYQALLPSQYINNVLWELTWIGDMVDPWSSGYGIAKFFGDIWVWLFGIRQSDNYEVTITIT